MKLEEEFLNYCKTNNFEINHNQVDLIKNLNLFYKSIIKKIFFK